MTNEKFHNILEWLLICIMLICITISIIFKPFATYFMNGMFILGVLLLAKNYMQAIKIVFKYKKIVVFLIPPSMWFAKVMASKIINRLFMIEPQYINNTLLFVAVSIFCLTILMIIALIPILVLTKETIYKSINKTISDKEFSTNFNKIFLAIPCAFIFIPIMSENYSEHMKYILISDAYYYSDCKDLSITDDNAILFLRKNDRECYKITRENASYNFFTWNPILTTIQSKKN